ARAAASAERDFRSHALDLVAARDDLAMHGRLPAQRALAMAAEARAAALARALDTAERDVALMLELTRIATMAGSLGLGAAGIEAGLFGPAIAALCFFAAMALGEVVAPLRRAVADWGRIGDAADRVAPMLGRSMPAPAAPAAIQALPLQVGDIMLGPGQILGLRGPSGSGKSTLLAQIAGLIPPGDTVIALAGRPVRDWPEAELRAALVMVPQRSALIAGTLRENLALAAPEADDDALREVLRAMRLDRLRGGLDLRLGDGGAGLSGGESRRLALARALLRQAPVLLLDEPTEGLDEETARHVMAETARRSRNAALVIASHRPSDLKQAAFIRSFV
uniref:ATP-binding cassette domain-containing protein n=1 Tax=Paracoccus binzhouensis TaxID=2796149 RepID=UPI0018EEE571